MVNLCDSEESRCLLSKGGLQEICHWSVIILFRRWFAECRYFGVEISACLCSTLSPIYYLFRTDSVGDITEILPYPPPPRNWVVHGSLATRCYQWTLLNCWSLNGALFAMPLCASLVAANNVLSVYHLSFFLITCPRKPYIYHPNLMRPIHTYRLGFSTLGCAH